MILDLELPWPPRALSPNARLNWRPVSAAKKAYRRDAYLLASGGLCAQTMKRGAVWPPQAGEFVVSLEFAPPDRRSYDEDNLIARMKSGLDGVADALGVNDKLFRLEAVKVTDPVPDGSVRVRIRAMGGS